VVHGHSSHHVKGIEVFQGKIILYGCGDFINDYEGIGGYETFRAELSLMYFVRLDPLSGKLLSVFLAPMRMRHFRVNRASADESQWLEDVLNREGEEFGTRVTLNKNGLELQWRDHGISGIYRTTAGSGFHSG
jgi:poly-gamma-glutamate synthesis protein (capsule biosynthesis protein)